jgi:hypothetical protein
MRWEVIRIRESEFEFDRDRELTRVWDALRAREIQPVALEPADGPDDSWTPVDLPDMDSDDEEPGEP